MQAIRAHASPEFIRYFGLFGSISAASKSNNHMQIINMITMLNDLTLTNVFDGESKYNRPPSHDSTYSMLFLDIPSSTKETVHVIWQLKTILARIPADPSVYPVSLQTQGDFLTVSEADFFLRLIPNNTIKRVTRSVASTTA